jgi:hypothetical protein
MELAVEDLPDDPALLRTMLLAERAEKQQWIERNARL